MSPAERAGQPSAPANGRPRGAVRQALADWARRWRESGQAGGLTMAELVAQVPGMDPNVPADLAVVRDSVQAMVRVEEWVRIIPADTGDKPEQTPRRLACYAPAPASINRTTAQAEALRALGDIAAAWVRAGLDRVSADSGVEQAGENSSNLWR